MRLKSPLTKILVLQALAVLLIAPISEGALAGGRQVGEAQQSVVYSEEDLERYVAKWERRDGLASVVISDYFLDFSVANPSVFFRVFLRNREVFNEWLAELPNLSFVDRGGSCVDLECRRTAIVDTLLLFQPPPNATTLHQLLIDRLRRTEVVHID